LPRKNVRRLCGKPLVAWTVEKALKSQSTDTVVVSTDSEEIAEIAAGTGAEVPFLRPAALATDTASTYDVIRHALAHYADAGREFDYTVLLEPTSPLREDHDVDRMLAALDESKGEFDSIVSVGAVTEHPSVMKRVVERRIEPYCPGEGAARRQENPPAFFPYGVAYIAKTPVLLEQNTFYTQRCAAYTLQRYQNYEIDDLFDFLCVEAVMRHQWKLE